MGEKASRSQSAGEDRSPPLEFQTLVFPNGKGGEPSMVGFGILKHFG